VKEDVEEMNEEVEKEEKEGRGRKEDFS